MSAAPVVYSGIPPGPSGTGRFVAYLRARGVAVVCSSQHEVSPRQLLRERRLLAATRAVLRHHWRQLAFRARLRLAARRRRGTPLVLLHPQSIGLARTLAVMRRHPEPVWLYLLDSGYFCIRSYNHVDGGTRPCTDCAGGDFDASRRRGCVPFPVADADAGRFVRELLELVRAGRVRLLAQCASQAALAQRHFGVDVAVAGLWCEDWNGCVTAARVPAPPAVPRWDVVYHGVWVQAKGAAWTLELAAHAPRWRFLLPFPRPTAVTSAPPNCEFIPMSWESGLADAVAGARLVLAPSLWSAPIEGALVKSIAAAPAVGVVANDSAWCAELPADLVLRLPPEPAAAAAVLDAALDAGWRADPAARAAWIGAFRERNLACAGRLAELAGAGR